MKKLIVSILGTLLCAEFASAQDIILKRDASEIEAKVLKVGSDEIEYKKWNNLEGPTYTIPNSEVFIIKYQNGTKDIVTTLSPTACYGAKSKYGKFKPHYQGEVAFAYGVGVGELSRYFNLNRIVGETVHGYRFSPYFAAGVGLGFNYFYNMWYEYDYNATAGMLSYFLNLKGYYPFSERGSVYLSIDLGGVSGVSGLAAGTEFYACVGPGIRYGFGDFSIRFQHMGEEMNAFLFRIGVNF